MRILVCGGRDYEDRSAVFHALDLVHTQQQILLVIHGGCSGAEALADEWAVAHHILRLPFKADWAGAADPTEENNQRMLDHGLPDGVLAFPGKGRTEDMVRRALAQGLKVWKPYG